MARGYPIKQDRRVYRPVFYAVGALALIVAWLLFGATGLFAWGDYSRQLGARQVELAELRAEQARLINRQRLLNPGRVDPDLADEMVREDLNLLHPDDIVIPLDTPAVSGPNGG
jgi:cell division protein FtsB